MPKLSSSQSAPSFNPTGAGAGTTLPIESEMIAYEAINELARELGKIVACGYTTAAAYNTRQAMSKKDLIAFAKSNGSCLVGKKPDFDSAPKILLGTPTNVSAISSFQAFVAAAEALKNLYYSEAKTNEQDEKEKYENKTPREKHEQDQKTRSLTGGAAITAAQAISATISTLKSTTTQTSATFTPVDQALYSDLEREFWAASRTIDLITMPYPGHYVQGNKDITELVVEVARARATAIEYFEQNSKISSNVGKSKYDPLSYELKSYEATFTSLQGILSGTNGPLVALGAALFQALKTEGIAKYDILTIANTAAGGGQRANTYFLLNIFVPAPHPSYNGGAVISYTIRTSEGVFRDSGMLRLVYGYRKWREKPLRNKKNDGYDNFPWDKERNKGHWVPIY